MARVYWTRAALGDVKDIASFIAKDSPTYAAKMAQRLTESTRRLRQFPFGGNVVPEFNDASIREVLIRPYRVIYTIRENGCFVLAVVHGSRDLQSIHSASTLQERTDDV
jgi:toxin ParE1/3/4